MSFRGDDSAAQEIIGFMLALAAVMVLFAASVGYGVTARDARVDDAAGAAVTDIRERILEAVQDAATWSERHPDAFLNLTITLPRMPGATGFIAEASQTTLFVNASSGAAAFHPLPAELQGRISGSISGTPEQALIRYAPGNQTIPPRITLEAT